MSCVLQIFTLKVLLQCMDKGSEVFGLKTLVTKDKQTAFQQYCPYTALAAKIFLVTST